MYSKPTEVLAHIKMETGALLSLSSLISHFSSLSLSSLISHLLSLNRFSRFRKPGLLLSTMSVRVFIYAYRKPGISLEEFKRRYEAHVELVKRISGEDFPLSHKRSYVARSTVEARPEGATMRNATTPATVLVGQQPDFDFDAYAELTFADEAAFRAFGAKVYAPEAAAEIEADEANFLDKSKLGIVMLGDVIETRK
jgi:hypothetical protein